MADQLNLSLWVRGFTAHNMLRHFERLLGAFPFSRLKPEALLTVSAVSSAEPVLVERAFGGNLETAAIVAAAREFLHPDCGYRVETFWDLWRWESDWKLRPAAVGLCCAGPDFESEAGEHLRIDFGADSQFLPQPDLPDHLFMARSNLKSLLHLVHDLEAALPVERRRLMTELGENFAARLKTVLQ